MLHNLMIIALCLLVIIVQTDAIGRMQSTAVRGRVTCNGKPESGLKIKLMDHDTFTPSDLMGQTVSAPDGTFYIAGHKTEFTSVVPEVRVYHKCGHFFFRHCSKIRIPSSYVFASRTPDSIYETGDIRLETMTSNC